MKKTVILLTIICILLVPQLALATQDVLRVGTEAGFKPFEFVDDKTNELVGFDMDLIREIGKVLGMEVKISNVQWDGLIPGLINGNFDAIIAGMTITEERAQSVNFSDPYFESVLTIVVREDNDSITDLADLAGKTAAVQISTTGDFMAEDVEGIAKISRFTTVSDAMQAVINWSADAAILDLPVAKAYLEANPNAPLKELGPKADNEYFGIALRKEDTELLAKVNEALAQLKADGTYDQLFAKWFSAE